MPSFSVLTFGIFVAGYITARWDLVTRLHELAIFAWDHGVITRTAKGVAILSIRDRLIPVSRRANNFEDGAPFEERSAVMLEHDGLMRIFWPVDIPRSDSPGVIVGWKNSDLDVLVVAILEDVEVRNVENALRVATLFRGADHSIERIYELCGLPAMHVLGTVNSIAPTEPYQINADISLHGLAPRISCAKAQNIQVIMFDRPLPGRMQYISLTPILLALGDKTEQILGGIDAEDEKAESAKRQREQELVEKLKLHTVTKHQPSAKELALPRIVNQINFAWELEKLLQKNISLVGTRRRRTLSVSERVIESASTMRDYVIDAVWRLITVYIYPIIRTSFVIALLWHRAAAELLLVLLEYRLRPEYAALKDISATAQQVEIRLLQFCYWPMQYVMLRKRKDDWQSIAKSHADYIRFYNSLWLVANDVIIGIAVGSAIIDNADWLAERISDVLGTYTVTSLQQTISWLMDWPAGLKLNNELAQFLGDLFLWVIDYWSSCVDVLRPILPHLIWFIGFSSFAGASMPIALFSDFVSLLTIHIYSFYIASAKIFHWQLTIILSLFHLFRGKKHNVLRKRIDSCDYDLDQLLLGTILFTLLFFLLPTVIVFYLTFAIARMSIISLKATLDTALACLNHFPLFALMLRFKDSQRLPGGIRFELRDTSKPSIEAPQRPYSGLTAHSETQPSESIPSPPPPTSYEEPVQPAVQHVACAACWRLGYVARVDGVAGGGGGGEWEDAEEGKLAGYGRGGVGEEG
ncbi:hypothetical protein O988_00354 [Pseudogymnoascus sp. VKM F-3808]|nr:hypothetical protein O988_00354 [Pseudogymnoascus sp. VKM F-3808]